MITMRIVRTGGSLGAYEKQVPFAMSKAINATLKQIQVAQQQGQRRRFNVVRGAFIDRLVKINRGDFATKSKLVGRVGIQGERASLLTKFEEGGQKVSISGRPYVALPSRDIKRTRRGKVAPSFALRNFRPFTEASPLRGVSLRGRERVADRRPRLVGQKNTFFITLRRGPLAGSKALLQAIGRAGRKRMLYLFVPSTRLPASLEFFETARAVVRSGWLANVRDALRAAIATARR